MKLAEWIQYEITKAEITQSKHADHGVEIDNIERWAYFQGKIETLKMVLREVEKHDI